LGTCFTRASTDNDRGGMELVLDFLLLGWAKPFVSTIGKEHFSYEMHWKEHGLSQDHPPKAVCSGFSVVGQEADKIVVLVESKIVDRAGRCLFLQNATYTVFSDNSILVSYNLKPTNSLLNIPSLARAGISFGLDPSFFQLAWFGRGPSENYPDRKTCSDLAVWQSTASKMGYDYIVPSENGSRSDCEWVFFESGQGNFAIAAEKEEDKFSFSAKLHSASELHHADHTNDLASRKDGSDIVHCHFDHRMMGLGGDVSWFPCVYPQFKVKPQELNFG